MGRIGWLAEGEVRIGARPVGRRHLELDGVTEPAGGLITFGAGEEGLLVDAVGRAGYRGLVVEGPVAAMSPPGPCQSSSAWRR